MMKRNDGPNNSSPHVAPPAPPLPRYPSPKIPPHHGVPIRSTGSSIPGPLERAIAATHHPIAATSTSPHQYHARVFHSDAMAVKASVSKIPTQWPQHSIPKQSAATPMKSAAASRESSSSPPSSPSKPRYKKRIKKYNNFNIFFMLERQLLLQSRGGGIDAIKNPIDTSNSPLVKSKELNLPPLCRRYNHLPLTSNWLLELLANQNKKRPHRKSHGLIPFKELAQTVAKNYREIDDETQSFVNEVAKRFGWHCEEMDAIEEKERKEQEEKGSARGIHTGSGKKRKDAPVVSVAGVKGAAGVKPGLSQDEATTVQQLMGMKSNSPPQPHQAMPPAHFQQHHPFAFHPVSERLRVELACAMNAKRDSEQRINMLKERVMQHSARTQQKHHRDMAASHMTQHHHASRIISPTLSRGFLTGHDQYLATLLAAEGRSPPLSSNPHLHSSPMDESTKNSTNPAHAASLKEVEKALLKEVLARRLVPSGAPFEALYPGAHAALHGHPPLLGRATPPSSAQTSSAPPKKRRRFSFENSGDNEGVQKLKSIAKNPIEAKVEETDRASSDGPRPRITFSSSDARVGAAESRSASARCDEIGFYNDLYAQLFRPRHTPRHAPAPSPRVTTAQDLALFDSIDDSLGGSKLRSVEQTMLENLAARGGSSDHSPHLPSSHFTPTRAHMTGYYPPPGAYAFLLRNHSGPHRRCPGR